MGTMEILLISIGLAMDAFAVAICKGLSMKKMNWKKAIIIAFYFGIFQALMPVIGYFLGVNFETLVTNIDHWIALVLLSIIGGNMIKEALQKEEKTSNDSVKFKEMVILAIATSIDALAVGITFAFLKADIVFAFSSIGIITFLISLIGVKIGNVFGDRFEKKAEIFGGCILIFLGIRILLNHLGIL